jgi:hypothetical protein
MPGEPWAIEVRDGAAVVGHIRQRPDTGEFCYYPGPDNQRTFTRKSYDLEALKRSILAAP